MSILQLDPRRNRRSRDPRGEGEGIQDILDPAPARALDGGLLRGVSVLTPNEHEAAMLAGMEVESGRDMREAAARIRARGPRTVVITLGERGVYASSEGFEGLVPAFKVEPMDTTAAGDVFNGALAVALAEKHPSRCPPLRPSRRRDLCHPFRRPALSPTARRSSCFSIEERRGT